jgi:hypothetical protein
MLFYQQPIDWMFSIGKVMQDSHSSKMFIIIVDLGLVLNIAGGNVKKNYKEIKQNSYTNL